MDFEELVRALAGGHIASPRLEAGMMMQAAADAAPREQKRLLEEMLEKRLAHYPLDKILGRRAFYKYDFEVSEDVLSPRPDTETLVEAAIDLTRKNDFSSVLDLGTGSGCILLSILGDCPQMRGVGVDKSRPALETAARNARRLKLEDRTAFRCLSWFDDNFVSVLGTGFDLLVSNPPYIPSGDIPGLDDEVRKHDPLSALDGGTDGLEHYKKIAEIAPLILKEGGYILLEAGIGQAADIRRIFSKGGLSPVSVLKDLAGIERCVILKK